MRWIPFLFLMACPVEPKDIQDLEQGKNGPGPGQQVPGLVNGKPPGSPVPQGENGGDQIPLPPPPEGEKPNGELDPNATAQDVPSGDYQADPSQMPEGAMPPNAEGGIAPQGGIPNGGTPDGVMPEGTPPPNTEAAPMGEDQNPERNHEPGMIKTPEGTHPTPNFEATQEGSIPAAPTAGDVLPLYQNLPQFSDIIDGETISINLNISGATAFDLEFVVKREGDGRVYPKVIHKETGAVSPLSITAPANFSETCWLVIIADKTGDGPTPDDLVGGPREALELGSEDMTLEFELSADSDFLNSLPWFSQADAPPEGGM